jgi:quercetin dioxygenase-like cupin family protein
MIKYWDTIRDGELTEASMRTKLKQLGYSVTVYTYPPGTSFPDHSHAVDKIDAVLSGQFRMSMNGQSRILRAGDMVEVPNGVVHSAEVVGDEPVISLDAVSE